MLNSMKREIIISVVRKMAYEIDVKVDVITRRDIYNKIHHQMRPIARIVEEIRFETKYFYMSI